MYSSIRNTYALEVYLEIFVNKKIFVPADLTIRTDLATSFKYVCIVNIPILTNRRYLFEHGNYQQFNIKLMNLDCSSMFNGLLVENIYNCFNLIYYKLLDKYILKVVISKGKDSPQ